MAAPLLGPFPHGVRAGSLEMTTEEFWLHAKAGVKEDPQYLSCPVGAWERRRLSSQIHGVHHQVHSFRSLCVSVVGVKSSRVRDEDRPCVHEGC